MSWNSAITAIDRYVKGKVEVYRDSTLLYTLMPNDYLKSIEIDRPSVKAFFGYAISQQATLELIDKNKELSIQSGDRFICYLGVLDGDTIFYQQSADFFVEEVDRNANGVDLTVKGYDLIKRAEKKVFKDLTLSLPSNIQQVFNQVCAVLGCAGVFPTTAPTFTVSELPNYNENDNLRIVLEDIAEALGCICFMSSDGAVLKPLTANNPYKINKANYFSFTIGESLTLTSIISSTPLEDNIQSGNGVAQIMNDNGFIVNRTDKATILDNLLDFVNGLTVVPYNLEWRGDPQLQMGDYIEVESKDGTIYTYYLGEKITYNGGMKATSNFELTYEDTLHTNSTTIGQRLNETIAKVDKINKTIELRVQEAIENDTTVAELKLSVGQIQGTVADLEGDVILQQTQITQTSNAITQEAQARSEEDAELRSLISQQADSITLQVKEEVKSEISDEYYEKQSSVGITANGINISSSGSINMSAGAKFVVDATNFKVNSNGYLTASGASLSSSSATNMTVYDNISLKDSSSGTESILIDSTSRYNGLINLGNNLKLYGSSNGAVIYANNGKFMVSTSTNGVSSITLNGTTITDFSAITGEAVFG